MNDLLLSLENRATAAEWEAQASRLQMSPEVLKQALAAAYRELPQQPEDASTLEAVLETRPADGKWSQDFDLSLGSIFGVKGNLTIEGTTDLDWKATLRATIIAFGIEIDRKTAEITPFQSGVTWELNVLNLAKCSLGFTLGIELLKDFVLHLRGSAAYYDFWIWNWRSADFDVVVARQPLPFR